jgi:hypothetical protein
MLHLRCGSDILWKLDDAGIPGRKVSWSDPLCQGPVPHADRAALRPVRAVWLAEYFGLRNEADLQDLVDADLAVDAAGTHDEVVLWFEADLFDQAILVHLLSRLGGLLGTSTRLSLVTLHEYPGVSRFIGLGQLSAPQLGALFPKRTDVTPAMVEAARDGWAAWTHPTPEKLAVIARQESSALPYLPAAVRRLLEELPDSRSGLGRTERHALEVIEGGAATLLDAFRMLQEREERPWLGDAMFYATMQSLARDPAALVLAEGGWPTMRDGRGNPGLAPTPLARDVLAGRVDWWPTADRSRWVAGTQLGAGHTDWRSDGGQLTAR